MTINVETGVTAKNFKLRNDYNGNVTPKIDQPATLNNNGGTVEDAELHGLYNGTSINVNNSGTIKNSEFSNAEIVNEAGATIEGSSLVRADSSRTWLKNLGTVQECALYGAFLRDGKYGTITNCVAWGENEFPEGVQAAEITIDGDARWTITDPRMPDRLATDKFYVVGSPTLKIQIWDDVKRTIVPLSNIDGDTNGIKTVEENGETWYQFTPDSSNKDSIVLNVREKHHLTVTGGGVIKTIDGTDTMGSPATADVKETLKVMLKAPEQDGKTFKEWKVTAGTAPTDFQSKSYGKYTLSDNPTSFYMPEGDVTLEATYYDGTLVIGEDGKPVTEGRKPYGDNGVQGDGWTYDGTTLKLNPTEAKTFDLTNSKLHFLDCELEVGENATIAGRAFLCRPVTNNGTINGPNFHKESYEYPPKLTNNGTVKNCYIDYGSVTNNGTMENVSFLMCTSLTNNADATIKNAVVRTDGRNMAYNNSGTIKNAVFEFKPSGETVHVLKTEGDGKNPSASVEGCSYGVSASQVYIIGEPVLKARIYDTVNRTYVTITNVNGNTSYGGLTADKDQNNYQKFTVQSGDTELVLNQGTTVTKYTLTLTNATANPDKTEYNDGDEITLTAKDAAEGKEFDKWELDGLMLVDGCQKTNATIKVKITGNATATATYKDKTYKLTLVNAALVGMTGTEFTENTTIKIKPKFTDEELELDCWSSETTGFDVSSIYANGDGTYTLKMPGNALTLTANSRKKTYSLTVVNGYIGDATDIRSGSFEKGAQITIVADAPANGFAFVGWNALNGTTCPVFSSADKDTRTYKFGMPAEKVELEAVYEPTGSGELVLVNGVPDINNAIRRDVHENVTTYFGRGWEYRVSDETDPSKNLLFLTGENFVLDKNSSSDSLKCNLEIGEYTSVKGTIPLTQAVKIEGTVDGMYFDSAVVTVDTIGTVTNSILHNVTVTNKGNINNCVSDTELPGAQALTEAGGATITATFDGCAGEISGETLYFTGTPTLKVKVAGGIVEKANNKPVGKADANGWYTVKAAEDDDGIVLNKGVTPDPEPKPDPKPNPKPTTYTITTDIYGEVNGGASATVKENDWVHMTVAEVPEGMTFDYWNIPDALLKALQKQNSGFRNNVENLNFQMPNMGEEEQTFAIKANFRSSELPGEDDGPSALGTMATVAVGGAAAGILVWQGVSLGVDSYLQLNLPQGVAVPTNRRELVVLLWETAGKPEVALPSLYSDVPAEEIELQKATRWAIDNGLVKSADDNDASRFDPDRYVTKYDVFGAWLKLKKLMKL